VAHVKTGRIGAVVELVVSTPTDEWHWHGAHVTDVECQGR
jgi:hypothetical protein